MEKNTSKEEKLVGLEIFLGNGLELGLVKGKWYIKHNARGCIDITNEQAQIIIQSTSSSLGIHPVLE